MNTMLRRILLLGLFLHSLAAMAVETLPAYNVYSTAPFVIDSQSSKEKGGLAADLVGYLNSKLEGKYQFELQVVPRERLNQAVLNTPNFKGVSLFFNPIFVGDEEKKKFAWTPAIMQDKNNVVSSIGKKIEYVDPDSLKGLQFEGVRGNRYAGLEERFGKDIKRNDVPSELQVLKIIAEGRADVTIVSATAYSYLMKANGKSDGLEGKLHVSANPHMKFDRFMFVAKENTELAKELSTVAAGMAKDPAWKAILAKYGVN